MARYNKESKQPESKARPEKPLQSWKEIAAYLDRDIRTTQRWEKDEALPVRRHRENRRGSVYAYPSELDSWRDARRPRNGNSEPKGLIQRRSILGVVGFLVLVLVAWFVKFGPILNPPNPLVKADDEIVIRQIWSGQRSLLAGGPSPDGKYLSFADSSTGNVALREIETGKIHFLTKNATWKKPMAFALATIVSPDSKLVAYSWFNEFGTYDLRLIGIDGRGSRTLYSSKDDEVYPVSWSSNDKQIVARRYYKDTTRDSEIVLFSTDSESAQVLWSGGKFWPHLAFSPDDQHIAFDFPVEEDSSNHDISLVSSDGGEEIPLVQHPANDRLLGWIPAREEVLFRSDRTGTQDIWSIQVTNGKVQAPPVPIKRAIGEITPKGFTQDGSFYFKRFTRWFTSQIVPYDPSTGEVHTQQARPILGSNFHPAWSPDGEYLAYVCEQTGTAGPGSYHRRLHVLHLKNEAERELGVQLEASNPRWSRNGRFILFQGFDKGKGSRGLYQVEVETGEVTCLVPQPVRPESWRNSAAEWSHGEQVIYYIDEGQLILRDMTSGQEERLYSDPNLTGILNLSPDGQWLVLGTRSFEEKSGSLLLMPASGGEVQEIFKKPKRAYLIRHPCWTPDSQHILFVVQIGNPGHSELWRVSPRGGDAEKLWQTEKSIRGLSIHPKNQEIALSHYTQESEIWVMEGYLSGED